MRLRLFIVLILLSISALLLNVIDYRYYQQAIAGHLGLMVKRTPIKALIEEKIAAPPLRQQLSLALQIRDFASSHLKLPDNNSYRSYVALSQPYVSWIVMAAPPLSLEPHAWCYPIVGCLNYRGFYDEDKAKIFANKLKKERLDVYVRGVTAYSSLGWFDDPLLSSMLAGDEASLAGVIFHELTHQRLFIKGDTVFNEGLAMAVEQQGVQLWLSHYKPSAISAYEHQLEQRQIFKALLENSQNQLKLIYQSDINDEQKYLKKQRIFDQLKQQSLQTLGDSKLVNWFVDELNNAQIASVAIYQDYEPAFTRLLALCETDFDRFYQLVEEAENMNKEDRLGWLASRSYCSE